MNDANVVTERASTRCFVCKLPTELLAALHADRFQNGMGFEALARKYAQPDRRLSEAGCRRHFNNRHVVQPEDSRIPEGDDTLGRDAAPSGSEVLDAQAVLETSTKALTEIMESLGHQYRAALAQQPHVAERLLATFVKVQAALARSIKQRDESRARREEFRKAIPHIVRRCISEALRAVLPLIREKAKNVRQDVLDVAHETLSWAEFESRLIQLEMQWPREVWQRVSAATAEALKVEELKAQD